MKKIRLSLMGACLILALSIPATPAAEGGDKILENNGLPAGPAAEVLPQGAVLHLQVSRLYDCLLNLEKLAKSIIPDKAIPPNVQPLMQTEHPLMTALGMHLVQDTLTAEKVEETFGFSPRQSFSLTLYPGDPRHLFVLSVPMANPQALTGFLKNVLQPKAWEEASLGDKSSIRVELPEGRPISELYIVCSDKVAFVCGARSLALALYNTPSTERLSKDAFMSQTIQRVAGQDISLIFNPSLIKPFLLQAQQLRSLAIPLLQAQKERLLQKVPNQIKSRIEWQLRRDMGVKDLNQLADYAECVVIATLNTLGDFFAEKLTAFEGFSMGAKLDAAYPQLTFCVYSHGYQPDRCAAPIPLDDVRKAMAWLGKEYALFEVQGRQPEAKRCPFFTSWMKQVRGLMDDKGLKSTFLDRWEKLVQSQTPPQSIATKVPWVLTTDASLNPPPAIRDYQHLDQYGQALANSLTLPLRQPVKLIPGKDLDFLAAYFKEQTDLLNQNTKAEVEFTKDLTGKNSFINKVSRFRSRNMPGDIRRFTTENAYVSRAGFFGYDQHEFINRKIYLARELDGYVVYHQDGRSSSWLSKLDQRSDAGLSPAMSKLMDRVPEGANFIYVNRVLQRLPECVNWLGSLEDLVRGDFDDYLSQAKQILSEAPSLEAAKEKLQALKMPDLIYSLNQDPDSKKVYCLLPGNVVYPREKLVPIFKTLFADFAAKANEDGGMVAYSCVRGESGEYSVIQNTEAIARLISTVGNTLIDRYLGSPDKQQQLRETILAKGDVDKGNFEQILVANPRWEFIPRPRQQKAARPAQNVPHRDPQTSANQVDLSNYYNASLTESWHGGGVGNNTLKNLPQGLQELGGVKFDVRGLVQLSGKLAQAQLTVVFPKDIKAIKVGRKAEHLHFLHATGWTAPEDTKIGCFLVHYSNGESREIPIVYGQDVRDWWTQPNEPDNSKATPVWTGDNTSSQDGKPAVRLFKTSWDNPLADAEIECIDYHTTMSDSAPFLIAITLE